MGHIDIVNDDFQLKNMWDFVFNDFPLIGRYVTNVNMPFQQLLVENTGTGSYYTGYEPYGDITVTLREVTRGEVYTYFKVWKDLIFDNKTKTFRSYPAVPDAELSPILKSATLTLTTYLSPYVPVESPTRIWVLRGLRLKGIQGLDFSVEDTGALEYQVVMSVDEIEEIY